MLQLIPTLFARSVCILHLAVCRSVQSRLTSLITFYFQRHVDSGSPERGVRVDSQGTEKGERGRPNGARRWRQGKSCHSGRWHGRYLRDHLSRGRQVCYFVNDLLHCWYFLHSKFDLQSMRRQGSNIRDWVGTRAMKIHITHFRNLRRDDIRCVIESYPVFTTRAFETNQRALRSTYDVASLVQSFFNFSWSVGRVEVKICSFWKIYCLGWYRNRNYTDQLSLLCSAERSASIYSLNTRTCYIFIWGGWLYIAAIDLNSKSKSWPACNHLHLLTLKIESDWLSGTGGWPRVNKAGRLGSNPGTVILKNWKTVCALCPASFPALMGGCEGTVHARCCHWFPSSAAFTAKAAAWPNAQASGSGRRRPLVTLRKESQKPSRNETGLTWLCPQRLTSHPFWPSFFWYFDFIACYWKKVAAA